jgi:tetratricopeptide (TPR) repeat protein
MRMVKFFLILALLFLPFAAKAQTMPKNKNANAKVVLKNDRTDEKQAQAAFETIKTIADVNERIEKLTAFLKDFGRSGLRSEAVELLIISHVEAGETAFRGGSNSGGAEHFTAAAEVFENNLSDKFFADIVSKIPPSLFFRNERASAFAAARIIESKVKDNAARLLLLANFYLQTENAEDAKRLAARAAEIAPDSAAAQITLGMANRIDFRLEAASKAFSRAAEIDATNQTAKRNLADAWRGLGQFEDALKIYRQLLAANPNDEAARNGLILALFNSGNQSEAEKELAAALEQNPKNIVLQTGAAYWYATNGDGKRAVELAQQAVNTEPRYVWGQIALARGLVLQRRPLEAERAILTAKQYGNFPTLDYELANAHYAAGIYDEAADDLRRSFELKNGKLTTKLGSRADAEAENFIELLSRERRASIFEPNAASSETEARKLKELLAFSNNLIAADETAVAKSAKDFAADPDEMSFYRTIYAASKLLSRKTALPQVIEFASEATDNLEKSLEVAAPSASVLAEELYEPRRLAATRGLTINVPEVPRETLRQILRGRIEELTGWSLYQKGSADEAAVHLRRAVAVLPEKSVWWRSSYWRLGSALETVGKSKDALAAYIKSYKAETEPSETRRLIIEGLYQKVYGSLEGLQDLLNQPDSKEPSALTLARNATVGATPPRPAPKSTVLPATETFINPLPSVIARIEQPKTKTEIQPKKNAEPENSVSMPKAKPVAESPAEINEIKRNIELPTADNSTKTIVSAPKQENIATENKANEAENAEKAIEKSEVENAPILTTIKPPELKAAEKKSADVSKTSETSAQKAFVGSKVAARPRVVVRSLLENPPSAVAEIKPEQTVAARCIMQISQNNLSVLRNGGTVSVLAIFGSAEDANKLKITINSPADLSVVPLKTDETSPNRRLFQITSISEITKTFMVVFESPCGREEVKIRVR